MVTASILASIHCFEDLLLYMREQLSWPIDSLSIDELTFEYDLASDLKLPPDSTARITCVKQLRPLSSSQPWSVFYVEFEHRYIPLRLLQRILKSLTIRSKQPPSNSTMKMWKREHLLFVCASGHTQTRRLDFVHFGPKGKATTRHVRVLGWDPAEPMEKLSWVEKQLQRGLCWPDESKLDTWPQLWAGTFLHRPARERTAWADLDQQARQTLINLYTAADLTVDALPYTPDFEWMAKAFNHATGLNLTHYDFWRALSTARKAGKMPRKQRQIVDTAS